MRQVGLRVLAVSAVVLLGGTVLLAGDFHSGSTLICSDCHVMHFSQEHGYNPNGTGLFTSLGTGGPFTELLRNDVNDLCLSCHDGQSFAPDVFEANVDTSVREAGALNRDNIAPYYDGTGHTLASTDIAPGGTFQAAAPEGLTCTNCHSPHGFGALTANPYRNLSGQINGFHTSVTYATGTNDPTKDVFLRFAGGFTVADMDLNEPDNTQSGFGIWCGRCHSDFHGTATSAEIGGAGSPPEGFKRHPTAGVDIGLLGGGHSRLDVYSGVGTKVNFVKVMSPTGVWPTNGSTNAALLPADLTPTCITCHKAHGNKNPFGLIYMENTGAVTEQGTDTGQYRDLCKQCHVQGG
ncbi:MAG: cytochrome c3 family protein [Acidobacteriota bacterium]